MIWGSSFEPGEIVAPDRHDRDEISEALLE
jgi:hypothetical protein